ncbi:MAG: HAD family phosphatase [Lachnospiraceae bacterium]|nr:HAD family phosphatase [Lachnospiraceae bacterium]
MKDHAGRDVRPFDPDRYRIAAFDFDGTLIPAYAEVPEEEQKALRALARQGVLVTAASGRNLTQVTQEILDLFRFCVLLNGAYVLDRETGEIVYASEMDREKTAAMARILEAHGGIPTLYQGAWQTTMDRVLEMPAWGAKNYADGSRELVRRVFIEGAELVPSAAAYLASPSARPVYKMHVVFSDVSRQNEAADAVAGIEGFTVLRMSNGDLEITNEGVSKATALEALAKSRGLTPENVVTFGDSLNDYEMMKASGYTVAMGNSDAFLFGIADYIADTCENDGAAKAVRALYGTAF